MRVALILPARTAHPGGVQRFGEALAERMEQHCELMTFRVHPSSPTDRGLVDRTGALAVGVTSLWLAHLAGRIDAVFSSFHWPPKLLPGVTMAGFVHDLRTYGLHSEQGCRERRAAPRTRLLKATLSTWDRVLVPSSHVAADVRRLLPRTTVTVVPEGLDHLDRYAAPADLEERQTVIVLSGRSPHKRPELALSVAERVAEGLGVQAKVIGYAPRPPRCPLVEVVSPADDASLAKLLQMGRVAFASSSYEGFGLAVGEAMRAGVPVVYTSDCPMSELVGDAGVSAPPTKDGCVTALTQVWTQSETLSKKATRQASEYTWDRTAMNVLSALRAQPALSSEPPG